MDIFCKDLYSKKMIELTVSIKGVECSFKHKFLIYEEVYLSEQDPIVKTCIEEALSTAKIVPEDIKVRALLIVK